MRSQIPIGRDSFATRITTCAVRFETLTGTYTDDSRILTNFNEKPLESYQRPAGGRDQAPWRPGESETRNGWKSQFPTRCKDHSYVWGMHGQIPTVGRYVILKELGCNGTSKISTAVITKWPRSGFPDPEYQIKANRVKR